MLPVKSPSMALVSEHQANEGRAALRLDGAPGQRDGMRIVPASSSVQEVAAMVRERIDALPGRRLATLVIWCHGEPGLLRLCNPPVTVDRLVPWFDAWRGCIDEVMLISCRVARIGTGVDLKEGIRAGNISNSVAQSPRAARIMLAQMDGNYFCSRLASGLRSRVIASTATQWNYSMPGIGPPSYPRNQIPDFEGDIFTWGPNGAIIDRRRNPSGRQYGDIDNS